MPNNIKISLKSKPETSVTLLISDEVKSIVQSLSITPSINFIATGERGVQGEAGTASINDNSITTSHIEDSSVTNSKIANGSVSTSKLGYGAVTTSKINSGAVTSQKIANSSISASKLQPNSVNASHIQNGTIIKELITDLSLPGGKLEDDSIGTIKILNNAVTKDKIASKTISGAEMEDNIILGGTTHVVSIQIDGSSPGYINGPSEDLLYIKSKKDLIFVVDSDENSHDDLSSFKFQNFAGTNLLELNESGHASLSGDLNVQGNINVSGLVDGIDISSTLVSVANNLTKLNFIGITQSVDLDAIETDVNLNTAKTGITTSQSTAITDNTSKTGITTSQASAIVTNTAKTGITTSQASAITANTAKTGITTSQADAITANTAKPDLTVNGAGTVHSNNYTDTVYTHPSNHAISVITGLQTALNSKQDAIGSEDLLIQQTDGLQDALDAKVDDSQVLTNVPANAVFTDTVYTHPANHAISVITGLQTALNSKQDGIGSEDLTIAMTDGLQDALDAKVDDSQVLTNVPANAVFTDTNTTYSVQDGELSQNNFTDADHTKLNNIEANATADQTKADIDALGIAATTAVSLTAGNKTIDGSLDIGSNQAGHDLNLYGANLNNTPAGWVSAANLFKFTDGTKLGFGTGNQPGNVDSSIQANGSNLVISNSVGNIQIGDTVEITGNLTTTGNIELGHATDTTLARSTAGEISVEGVGVQLKNMHHHFIHAGFYLAYPYSRYIPLNGSLNEQNVATSTPEYVNYTFPYDGYVKKMILRSETNMGSTNLKLYKGASGATVTTVLGDVSASVGANAAVEFDFTSVSSAYSKGDTMAIKVDPTEDPDGGQNITIELVFDLTT